LLLDGAFAYSNYRYSEYKFIYFSDSFANKIDTQDPLIVFDIFQQKRGLEEGVLYLEIEMNML
jgi:hypothetical protein